MVSLRTNLILLVVVLFAACQIVNSLECYHCESDCVGNNKTISCKEEEKLCLFVKDDKGVITKQSCATKETCGDTKRCETCDKKLCNFSPSFGPSLYIIGIASILVASLFTH